MGKREDALALVREGLSPSQIAARQAVTLSTIVGYLDQLVGRGALRRSDVYFTHSPELRATLRRLRGRWVTEGDIVMEAIRSGQDFEDTKVALHYGSPSNFLGDMYEDLAAMEIGLHRRVGDALEAQYGPGWWASAVPVPIRTSCEGFMRQARRAGDSPYLYTTLAHLHDIIQEQWSVLKDLFEPQYAGNLRGLRDDLRCLNKIRNKVMHPAKGDIPTEDDFLFVQRLRRSPAFV